MRIHLFAPALFALTLALPAAQPYAAEEHNHAAHAGAAEAPTPTPVAEPFAYVMDEMDIVTGNPDAPVTIVEYASLSCPHCAHFNNEVLPELKKKYIDTGKAKLVFRHFPLNPPALNGAMVVECAERGQREKFLKVLFATQDKWAFDVNAVAALTNIASVGGLSKEKIEACRADKALEERILKVVQTAGAKSWVSSTPTFFINNTRLEGDHGVEPMSKAIDALLAK